MGKQHSDDRADRRGGRKEERPGSFGRRERNGEPGNRAPRSGDRREGYSAARPTFGRPPTDGAFGKGPNPNRREGGSTYGRRDDDRRGNYGSNAGPRSYERRDERPRPGKEQRSGTSYGRLDRQAERRSFGPERNHSRDAGRDFRPDARDARPADGRPVRDYQPRENWPGQPYRQEGRPTVPRGEPGQRNRKFNKQNPNAPREERPRFNPQERDEQRGGYGREERGTSFGRDEQRGDDRNPGFGRSAPREGDRPETGPNRPIRAARPFEANPPQERDERGPRRDYDREERGGFGPGRGGERPNDYRTGPDRRDDAPTGYDRERAERRADEEAFGRKFTPGAFGRRDGQAPGSPRGKYADRPGRRGERPAPAPGSFAERREALKAQERSVRRSGTAYGSQERGPRPAPVRQENRADKPRYGERPGEAPDYKNLKHYENDKTRGNKRRREEADDFGQDEMRLNRYIANAGICSRRDADALIAAGEIKVNGEVVTEMGYKVQPTDTVQYGKTNLNREKAVYVLLNKPKDFLTTTEDPEGRRTVMDLVATASKERIFPVGRLDRNTTGLLLFTNDGEVAQKLSHPSHKNKKIYQVELSTPLTEEHLRQIAEGLELEDGKAVVDDVAVVAGNAHFVGIEIHIGRNRIVRRIFEHLGYEVVALDRVQYAGLTKKDLPRGKWRFLNEQEVIRLKYFL